MAGKRGWVGAVVGMFLMAGASFGAEQTAVTRVTTSFDPDWRFVKGDSAGAEKPDFADSAWEKVDVPHDWAIAGPYDQDAPSNRGGGYLPSGISWYRKHFELPADFAQKRVFINFEGIMANAEVWINGESIGKRPYGYVPQDYELTSHLKFGPGQTNVLAVRTETTKQPASRWYTGQGIFRHVRLVAENPVHLEQYGTYITTPTVAADSAQVFVVNTVVNQSDKDSDIAIQTTLFGPDGKSILTELSSIQHVAAGQKVQYEQNIKLANPQLWDVDHPNVYRAVSAARAGATTLDEQASTFGIRSAVFKAETGFELNGKSLKIVGVCLHADGGAVGAAVPARVWERRLEILKSLGVNAIRTAHNPPNPDFLDLCDRMGFMVMEETFDTWLAKKNNADFGYQLYFRDWWEADTRAMVLRDRNHPSIVIYSIGNEIRDNLNNDAGKKMLTDQRDVLHKFDPTRPVTMALFRPTAVSAESLDLLDVVGSNYAPGFLLQTRQANAARKVIDTEDSHSVGNWLTVRRTPSIAGLFVWSGIDYLGETAQAGGWPYVVSSDKPDNGFGLLEHDGYIKPLAYQFQSYWSDKPMVKVVRNLGHEGTGPLVNDWTPLDPDTFNTARVEVITNCDEVELFLNDKSLGSKTRDGNSTSLEWKLEYDPGVLKAVAKKDGKVIATDELKTAGTPAKLAIVADRQSIAHEFDDVSHVTVTVVDKDGLVCPNATQKISFQIGGAGKLIATSTGDRMSHQSFADSQREAFRGQVIAIVRSTADAGSITVSATAPGLEGSSITLSATPATQGR